jgi:hypothetical protein
VSFTIVEGPDLREWYSKHIVAGMGFQQVSTSPKPVHVLHGLLDQLYTGQRMTRLIEDLAARSNGLWKVSQDEIRVRHSKAIHLPQGESDLDELRYGLAAVVASDDAFFRGFPSSQVAHIGMIGKDRTDGGIGRLAASIIGNDPESRALAQAMLDRLRSPQPNPHWPLQRTLIDESASEMWGLDDPIDLPDLARQPGGAAPLFGEATCLLRRALSLVTECDSLFGLEVLSVAATWVSLLVYAQAPQLVLHGSLHPIVVECADPGQLTTVRDASAEQLNQLHAGFQEWVADLMIESSVQDFGSDRIIDHQAIHYLRTHTAYKLAGGKSPDKFDVDAIYDAYNTDSDRSEVESLGMALKDALILEMGDKNKDWFNAVGRNCGFVGPRRGRMPRARCEVAFLPVLLLAGLPDEPVESIAMADWLDNLFSRFGLVLGPLHSAMAAMDPRPSESDMTANQSELAHLLTGVGLAQQFSDGVTEVLDPRRLWKVR